MKSDRLLLRTHKTCNKCKETKPLDQFRNMKRSPDGKQYRCRACQNEDKRQPQRRERSKAYLVEWRSNNPDYSKKASQKRRGVKDVDVFDWDRYCADKGFKCEACGESELNKMRRDHDHDTGLTRALLCDACNRGMGFLGDNLRTLEKLAEILRRPYQEEYVKRDF